MAFARIIARFAAAALLLAALMPPAGAADFDPQNFEVNVTEGGDPGPSGSPTCADDLAGTTCVHEIDYSLTDEPMSGTVRESSTGLRGAIAMVCDVTQKMTFTWFTPSDPAGAGWETASGNGSQACSWHMAFNDDVSSLTGTIVGNFDFGMVEGAEVPTMYSGGDFTVVVVAGAGEFAGAIGEGTFSDYFEEPFGQEPAGPARTAARAAQGSAMALSLRSGRYKAVFVSPSRGGRVRLASTAPLQVVSVAGRSCAVTATRVSDGLKRRLDDMKDGDGDGLYQLRRFAEQIGRAGTWSLEAKCSYRKGGELLKAVGTTRVDLVK